MQKFIVELGKGFAFMGRQFYLQVGEHEYFPDLLFYHVKLHCYVVIEIKNRPFQPEDAGKLNFYLSVINEQLKDEVDHPTIGLLLCRGKDKLVAEYAFEDINKPMGISTFERKLLEELPLEVQDQLPSIEEFERGLSQFP